MRLPDAPRRAARRPAPPALTAGQRIRPPGGPAACGDDGAKPRFPRPPPPTVPPGPAPATPPRSARAPPTPMGAGGVGVAAHVAAGASRATPVAPPPPPMRRWSQCTPLSAHLVQNACAGVESGVGVPSGEYVEGAIDTPLQHGDL